jgi:hypothetical protein
MTPEEQLVAERKKYESQLTKIRNHAAKLLREEREHNRMLQNELNQNRKEVKTK